MEPDALRSADPPPRRRKWWWLVGGLAIVALAAAGLAFGNGPSDPAPPPPGGQKQAPAIDLPAMTGEGRVTLAALRGRPVVINLFASWCVPCRNELPAFASVSERMKDKVAFLGINHQDNRKAGQDMLAEYGVRYPAGYDPDGKVAIAYGLIGMPTTLFVAADGRLLDTHTGELSRRQLEQSINRLFAVS